MTQQILELDSLVNVPFDDCNIEMLKKDVLLLTQEIEKDEQVIVDAKLGITRGEMELDDLVKNKPDVARFSKSDYDAWVELVRGFEGEFGNLEKLRNCFERHLLVKPQEPILFDGKQNKIRLDKWYGKLKEFKIDNGAVLQGSYEDNLKVLQEARCELDKIILEKDKVDVTRYQGVVDECMGIYNGLLEDKPQCPIEKGKRKTEYAKFTRLEKLKLELNVHSDENVDKIVSYYPVLNQRLQNIDLNIEEIRQLLDSCNKHEFNPKCKACMKHPWKLEQSKYEERLKSLVVEKKDVMAEMMDRFGGSIDEKDYQLAVDNLDKLKEWERVKKEWEILDQFWKEQEMIEERYQLWFDEKVRAEQDLRRAKDELEVKNGLFEVLNQKYVRLTDNVVRVENDIRWIKQLVQEWNDEYASLEKDIVMQEEIKGTWQVWKDELDVLERKLDEWTKLEEMRQEHERSIELRKVIDLWNMKWDKTSEFVRQNRLGLSEAEYKVGVGKEKLQVARNKVQFRECSERLMQIDQAIEKIKRREEIRQKILVNVTALSVVDYYEEGKACSRDIEALKEDKHRLMAEVENLRVQEQAFRVLVNEMDGLLRLLNGTVLIHNTLKAIIAQFSNFKDWVIDNRIIPLITGQVNKLLKIMCVNHRDISLDCNLQNGVFIWRLRDGVCAPPIEKASGFQKFIVSLSMRIVLGRLGVSGIRNRQLFIDEGFTACDNDNLANIPNVLEHLLKVYGAIVLVSHLDELKHGIKSFINIDRDVFKNTSKLNFGSVVDEFKTVKKVGRPRKNKVFNLP